MAQDFDIIVVGGGHAGYEAAQAAAKLGARTLLVALDLTKLGELSCNPAVGGLAKGQMVREIDALGGLIGKLADRSGIQFRTLNRGKGPAVRTTRTQNDRVRFVQETIAALTATENLTLQAGEVTGITIDRGAACGVVLRDGTGISSRAVILACGTFLNGLIHIGMESFPAGRMGEAAACGLTECLQGLGIRSARLKTGTPARLNRHTIDYSVMSEQRGEVPPPFFSLESTQVLLPQVSCFLTHTTEATHRIIRDNLDRSPLFSGKIRGIGPRYCPSIEDKVVRFTQHLIHQVFIEPEGIDSHLVYLNGVSSSLPKDVQELVVASITGLEKAKIEQYAYAIEYDFFPPVQLRHTLESKVVENLYFAGQINGTSGYEEAAAQGFVAGVNAARKIDGKSEWILSRKEAYIGVLIDDLVSRGTEEPYRMFTSRAEHRLTLRDDNAYFRLTETGYALGMIGEERRRAVQSMKEKAEKTIGYLRTTRVDSTMHDTLCKAWGRKEQVKGMLLYDVAKRADAGFSFVFDHVSRETLPELVKNYLESELKYAGYIEREKRLNKDTDDLENEKIPRDFPFLELLAMSFESRQKMAKIMPETVAQAARIPGVRRADIEVLRIFLQKKEWRHGA